MVETALHVALVAFQVRFSIIITLGKGLLAVAHAMRLDIRLCHYIDTVLVAKVIPKIVVGIMAGAHGVQVELLHHLDVLQHTFARDDITAVRVHLMTVGALEEDGLAVDKYLFSLQFYLAETYLYGNHFTAALQGGTQGIQVGCFCRPFMRILHIYQGSATAFGSSCSHLLSGSVQQFKADVTATLHIELHSQGTVAVVGIQVGSDADILDAFLVAGIEIAITPYTAVAEEVLVFEIGTVAPAEYLEGNQILLAGLQVRGQVEFGFELAVFTITYITAVHPQIHIGGDRAEMGDDVLILPVGGHGNLTAVRTYMIVLDGHLRRVVLELVAPGVANIHIDRIAKAVQFPHAGDGDVVPTFVIVAHTPEVGRASIGILHPEELPDAVQCHETGRLFFQAPGGDIGRLVGEVVGVHGGTVHGVDLRVEPFFERLCAGRQGQGCKQSGNKMFLHDD